MSLPAGQGVKIGNNVYLAYDVNIDLVCPELVEIGDNARIGIGVIILAHNRPSDALLAHLGEVQQPVRIVRDAVIAAGVAGAAAPTAPDPAPSATSRPSSGGRVAAARPVPRSRAAGGRSCRR